MLSAKASSRSRSAEKGCDTNMAARLKAIGRRDCCQSATRHGGSAFVRTGIIGVGTDASTLYSLSFLYICYPPSSPFFPPHSYPPPPPPRFYLPSSSRASTLGRQFRNTVSHSAARGRSIDRGESSTRPARPPNLSSPIPATCAEEFDEVTRRPAAGTPENPSPVSFRSPVSPRGREGSPSVCVRFVEGRVEDLREIAVLRRSIDCALEPLNLVWVKINALDSVENPRRRP